MAWNMRGTFCVGSCFEAGKGHASESFACMENIASACVAEGWTDMPKLWRSWGGLARALNA